MKLCGIPRSVICPDINCCLSSKLMLTLRGINDPENCVCGGGEGALTDFHIKAAATESVMIVAEVDKVHSASAKNDLSLPNFCHPDVLVTWQPSALESEKLR